MAANFFSLCLGERHLSQGREKCETRCPYNPVNEQKNYDKTLEKVGCRSSDKITARYLDFGDLVEILVDLVLPAGI